MQAIKAGRKIVAIKLLMETTGIGMANAKVLVDRAITKHAPRPPRQAVMKDYRPLNLRVLGTILILAGAVIAFKILVLK